MKGEERVMDVQGVRKSDMGCPVIGHARAFLYSDNLSPRRRYVPTLKMVFLIATPRRRRRPSDQRKRIRLISVQNTTR